MNKTTMKLKGHFLSEEKIISDLYEIVGYENSCNLNLECIIKQIAFFYFNYQNNIENLFNDKFSFYFCHTYIYLNNVFLMDRTANFFYSTSYEYKTEEQKVKIIIHSDYNDQTCTIAPISLEAIDLYCKETDCSETLQLLIKQYLFSHLSLLDSFYKNEILEINKNLTPLSKTILFLIDNKINMELYFKLKKFYSRIEIYDTLKDNEDIFLINYDINIQKIMKSFK